MKHSELFIIFLSFILLASLILTASILLFKKNKSIVLDKLSALCNLYDGELLSGNSIHNIEANFKYNNNHIHIYFKKGFKSKITTKIITVIEITKPSGDTSKNTYNGLSIIIDNDTLKTIKKLI